MNNFFQKMLSLLINRRNKRRYAVSWDALIDVCFPDFQDCLAVRLTDFSETGARLLSERVYLERHHLIASNPMPRLNLKVFSPEGIFYSGIIIRWYQWSVEKALFEIGVEFNPFLEENALLVDKLISRLHHQKYAKML